MQRSLSPSYLRKERLLADLVWPKSYTVEAVAAIPHPVPTHALASSLCMSHLLTGSDDGYIRDYDVFSAVNGKVFLTAPQRHHCGVIEGILKGVPIRCWWENPLDPSSMNGMVDDQSLASVYSLLIQSDALWALSGSEVRFTELLLSYEDTHVVDFSMVTSIYLPCVMILEGYVML